MHACEIQGQEDLGECVRKNMAWSGLRSLDGPRVQPLGVGDQGPSTFLLIPNCGQDFYFY